MWAPFHNTRTMCLSCTTIYILNQTLTRYSTNLLFMVEMNQGSYTWFHEGMTGDTYMMTWEYLAWVVRILHINRNDILYECSERNIKQWSWALFDNHWLSMFQFWSRALDKSRNPDNYWTQIRSSFIWILWPDNSRDSLDNVIVILVSISNKLYSYLSRII